jgi:RNA polymerase sigma factor (sigma-70 family)
MEVSALKYSGGLGLHGRTPLLRLQSDERLVGLLRRGNTSAFEVLVSRYSSRLLAFCRHLLGSREDAEDVLQEVLAAAFNAILADERPINVRPWLYRIARNRCLNHLRRIQAVGVDSMDIHLSDNGASTADKVHEREEFRVLVDDIHELPETQKTALVLREMDALSYEQIAEAMETTVPSVKSLLVRARISLAEASEARLLSCDEVRIELGEVAEGLRRRPSPLVRRHLRACKRCESFRVQLKETNKALAALLPIGPLVLLKKLALTHLGHSAGSGAAAGSGAGSGAAAGSTAAVAGSAAAGSSLVAGSTAGGFITAGIGAIATKAAAGLAAAALVTGAAVEVDHSSDYSHATVSHTPTFHAALTPPAPRARHQSPTWSTRRVEIKVSKPAPKIVTKTHKDQTAKKKTPVAAAPAKPATTTTAQVTAPAPLPGRTQTQTDATVLKGPGTETSTTATVLPPTSTVTALPPDTSTTPPDTTTAPPDTTTIAATPPPPTTTTTPETTTTTTPDTTPPPAPPGGGDGSGDGGGMPPGP